MKKIVKKFIALFLAIICCVGIVACKDDEIATGDSDGKVIEIKGVIAGYDVQWLTAIVNEFNKVYKDEYEAVITLTDTSIDAANEIKRPKYCTTDIFFEYNIFDSVLPLSYSILKKKDVSLIEDLTDVWNSPAIGMDKKPQGANLIDRVDSQAIIESVRYHGNMQGFNGLYGIPWQGGSEGVYVNPTVLKERGNFTLDDLLTTDDWLNVLSTLAPDPTNQNNLTDVNGFFPMAWSQNYTAGYFDNLFHILMAQYEGATSHSNFVALQPDTGTVKDNGYSVYEKRGIYESLSVIEKLLNRDWASPSTTAQNHVQAEALVATGKSACMITGDYMYKELEKDYADYMQNVISIKIPVISALGVKLNLCGAMHNVGDRCADCNAKLRAIVKAVDGEADTDEQIASAQGISADKVKTIREARGYYVANHGSVQAFIPSYSDAKVGAKLFLRFMFSDEMMKLYREYTYVDLPFKYTNEPKADEREFMQAMYEIKSRPNSRSIQCFIYSNLRAQIPTYPKQNTVVATFQGLSYSHQYGTPLYTAKGIYDDNIEYVKTKWTTYLQAAGYSD